MPKKPILPLGSGEPELAPLDWMVRKLQSIGDVSRDAEEAIRQLTGTVRNLGPKENIVREGDKPSSVCLMLSGYACRYKHLLDGERQILSFHMAGDVPDAQSLYINRMDHSLAPLTPATVLHIPHAEMFALFRKQPDVADLFWRSTLIDAAIFREWMIGLGRRQAYGRISHLFCEQITLMTAAGLTTDNQCNLPLTQTEIGDATGMSTVHVNLTLQEMRADKLITLQFGSLTILDWDGLIRAAEFDPAYLHLVRMKPGT